jgi:AcrR family transcriptional regulator
MGDSEKVFDSIPVRDRLLDAAEQVVARDGVGNLTLDVVAREAGVSKGGLLYHFPSKAALVTAIVERLAARCDGEHQCAMVKDGRTDGAFARAYLVVRATQPDRHMQHIDTALLAAAGTDPRYLEPIRAQFEKWQARLDHDGVDPVTATIVRLAADGLALGDLLGLAVPTGERRRLLIDRLLAMTMPSTCGETQP